jgi:hypothetical protein
LVFGNQAFSLVAVVGSLGWCYDRNLPEVRLQGRFSQPGCAATWLQPLVLATRLEAGCSLWFWQPGFSLVAVVGSLGRRYDRNLPEDRLQGRFRNQVA